MATIEELLAALRTPVSELERKLPNTLETWTRIGNRDSFAELGLSGSELDKFLQDWINENSYNNI